MNQGTLASEILPGCSARIDVGGVACGTGFFVTARDVVTCRHVIDNATELTVRDRFGRKHVASGVPVVTEGLDLAWVRLRTPDTRVPVALLGAVADTGDELYSFGYPEDNAGEPATFDIEGLTGDEPPRIKFKAGQVKPGMSGSPLLNMRTGAVCAVLVSTRGRQSSLGGYGIPVSAMLACRSFRELGPLNASAHINDSRWMGAMAAEQRKYSSAPANAPGQGSGVFITNVSEGARVEKIVNIGDINGPVTF